MSTLDVTAVWYEALFASALQPSECPAPGQVRAEINRSLEELGCGGCVDRVAQEFGDHPESAQARMRWARDLVAATYRLEASVAG